MSLRLNLEKLDARYDDCGHFCGQTQKPSPEFCAGCPIKKADERFKKETLSALTRETGEGWRQYGFDFLQTTLFAVMDLEDEADLFTGTETLVNIVKNERNKISRIEHQKLIAGIKNNQEHPKNGGKRRQHNSDTT